MSDTTLNILSEDKSDYLIQVFTSFSSNAVSVQMGMWGAEMFGTPQILGGGWLNTYTNESKLVKDDDISLYVRKT